MGRRYLPSKTLRKLLNGALKAAGARGPARTRQPVAGCFPASPGRSRRLGDGGRSAVLTAKWFRSRTCLHGGRPCLQTLPSASLVSQRRPSGGRRGAGAPSWPPRIPPCSGGKHRADSDACASSAGRMQTPTLFLPVLRISSPSGPPGLGTSPAGPSPHHAELCRLLLGLLAF